MNSDLRVKLRSFLRLSENQAFFHVVIPDLIRDPGAMLRGSRIKSGMKHLLGSNAKRDLRVKLGGFPPLSPRPFHP
ncbi:hypothetical protein [Sphingopyxis sp. FD7]|uniref:hypothetical protein n=1 Tax=Sphingopyxis sp. FD7 TaxID=1914525 RepID=UPI0011BA72C8|nr:hypothetical protein [Sphingopyxis sp. FD7]